MSRGASSGIRRCRNSSAEERRPIYDAMNDGLAKLHAIDVAAAGLSDYGKPGSYFARQLQRWTEQYRASETGTVDDMERLIAWLADKVPADDGRLALVHGDWRIDNMIFEARSPRLLAVLDWELSTLGHPFADLAYQCMHWRLPHTGFNGLGGIDREARGIPGEAEYVAAYCRRADSSGFRTGPSSSPSAFFATPRSPKESTSVRSTATPRTPSAPASLARPCRQWRGSRWRPSRRGSDPPASGAAGFEDKPIVDPSWSHPGQRPCERWPVMLIGPPTAPAWL